MLDSRFSFTARDKNLNFKQPNKELFIYYQLIGIRLFPSPLLKLIIEVKIEGTSFRTVISNIQLTVWITKLRKKRADKEDDEELTYRKWW